MKRSKTEQIRIPTLLRRLPYILLLTVILICILLWTLHFMDFEMSLQTGDEVAKPVTPVNLETRSDPDAHSGKPSSGDSVVFGLIPTANISTKIIYSFTPNIAREVALTHDGKDYGTPLINEQWRQIIFELGQHKIHKDVLPDYMDYLTKIREYRINHTYDNREPILIMDIHFEWIDEDLAANPDLEKYDRGYRIKDGVKKLSTNKARFFGASILPKEINSRLVTFAYTKDLLFTNNKDKITHIEVTIGNNISLELEDGDTKIVDLGDNEGERIVLITGHHKSGLVSRSSFKFNFRRDVNGQWVNVTTKDGQLTFGEGKEAPIIFIK